MVLLLWDTIFTQVTFDNFPISVSYFNISNDYKPRYFIFSQLFTGATKMTDVSPDKSRPRNAPSGEKDESESSLHAGQSLANKGVQGKEQRNR